MNSIDRSRALPPSLSKHLLKVLNDLKVGEEIKIKLSGSGKKLIILTNKKIYEEFNLLDIE